MFQVTFNHKRLRSNIELCEFLLKYPHCPIDPRHVNMEKLPEVITGSPELLNSSTKKLMEFVEKLKRGEPVQVFKTFYSSSPT